jgi:two-component system, LuxR family, sensor kinase FixL
MERLQRDEKITRIMEHDLLERLSNVYSGVKAALRLLNSNEKIDKKLFELLTRVTWELESCEDLLRHVFRPTEVSYHFVPIKEIVERAERTIRLTSDSRRFVFQCSIVPHISMHNVCLAAEEILRVLLLNSVEALSDLEHKNRRPTIQLEVHPSEQDGYVTAIVTDNGPGISPHLRDRVFELGFTTKANRSGMGLFLARKIAASIGASVALLRSEWGQGATFALTLPAKLPLVSEHD